MDEGRGTIGATVSEEIIKLYSNVPGSASPSQKFRLDAEALQIIAAGMSALEIRLRQG